jgi:hypothetical protein
MAICLTDWNAGMDDAEAGLLAQSGMPPDYYGGYHYACALDYEYMGLGPKQVSETHGGTLEIPHSPSFQESLSAMAHATEELEKCENIPPSEVPKIIQRTLAPIPGHDQSITEHGSFPRATSVSPP